MAGKAAPHGVSRLSHILFATVFIREHVNNTCGGACEALVYGEDAIISAPYYCMFEESRTNQASFGRTLTGLEASWWGQNCV